VLSVAVPHAPFSITALCGGLSRLVHRTTEPTGTVMLAGVKVFLSISTVTSGADVVRSQIKAAVGAGVGEAVGGLVGVAVGGACVGDGVGVLAGGALGPVVPVGDGVPEGGALGPDVAVPGEPDGAALLPAVPMGVAVAHAALADGAGVGPPGLTPGEGEPPPPPIPLEPGGVTGATDADPVPGG